MANKWFLLLLWVRIQKKNTEKGRSLYYKLLPFSVFFASFPFNYIATNWSLSTASGVRVVWLGNCYTGSRPVRKGGSGGSDEPPPPPLTTKVRFFFFFFFFLFGWQNLERALVCVRKTAAIFPTKWVEFENPQPTNVCFDWEMCGNRRASNERSPTLHCEATCVRRNLLVFVHSRGPFLCRRKCPWWRDLLSIMGRREQRERERKRAASTCQTLDRFFQQRNVCLRERILKLAVTVTVRLWLSLSLLEFLRLFTLDSQKLGRGADFEDLRWA